MVYKSIIPVTALFSKRTYDTGGGSHALQKTLKKSIICEEEQPGHPLHQQKIFGMDSSQGESHIEQNTYIYKWHLRKFDCSNVRGSDNLPSTQFQFNSGVGIFNGTVSLKGVSCYERVCELRLTNSRDNKWKATCNIKCGKNRSCQDILSENRNFFQLSLSKQGCPSTCCLISSENILEYEITLMRGVIHRPTKVPEESRFLQDFAQLFDVKKFCDVKFRVAGKEFQAHKNVLACRSHVFAAMFELQMKEAISNEVLIEDIEAAVFEELLRFIYTDNVLKLKDMAIELFKASDKYDLSKLKSMCENELSGQISIDNAAEILLLADLHKADELKKNATDFILFNKNAVIATNGWKEILQNNPHFLIEVLLETV